MTVLSLPSPASSARRPPAVPRWATPRRPERATYGPAVGHVAATLGKPLRPWQQQVADVALEVNPATGRLAYRQIVLTVPRQQGKSILLLAVMVHRMVGMAGVHGRQAVNYAAQSAMMARKKFLTDYANSLTTSALKSEVTIYKGMGQAGIILSNGSRSDVTAGTEKSGHGDVLDLGIIDEAFAQPDGRIEQAFRPAMQTRKDAQIWIVSTAGNADSVYLRKKIDYGRAVVESGRASTTACFEWSAPDDADPTDPETWWSCMPSLGYGVTEDTIRSDLEDLDDLDQFRRAYLNQWLDGKTAEQVIDPQHWKACADPGTKGDSKNPGMQLDDSARITLAVDVSPSRNQAAIAAAGLTTFGSPGIEVIDTDEGTEWIVPRLRELRSSLGPAVLAVDGAGPAASLIPDLIEAGWRVATAAEVQRDGAAGQLVTAARSDVVAACGQLYDVAVARRLRHRAQPVLNDALAGAAKRPVGDAWAWGRRQSAADITPLMATTVALWAHTRFVRAGLQPVDPLLTVF